MMYSQGQRQRQRAGFNPIRGQNGPMEGGGGFNPLAAGAKRYGTSGRMNPNQGKVADTTGYFKRDNVAEARKKALYRRAAEGN